MNLLLDTHVALWCFAETDRLKERIRAIIESADQVYVSVASAWEFAIKVALGRLRLPEPFDVALKKCEFMPLLIQFSHAEILKSLPLHHGDPFDRLLVAQAQVENLTIVSSDRWIDAYDVSMLRA